MFCEIPKGDIVVVLIDIYKEGKEKKRRKIGEKEGSKEPESIKKALFYIANSVKYIHNNHG